MKRARTFILLLACALLSGRAEADLIVVTPENVDRQPIGLSVEYMRLEPNEKGEPARFWFTVTVKPGELSVTPCTDGTLTIMDAGPHSWISQCKVSADDRGYAKVFTFGLREAVLQHSDFRVRYQHCGSALGRAAWTIDLSSFVAHSGR